MISARPELAPRSARYSHCTRVRPTTRAWRILPPHNGPLSALALQPASIAVKSVADTPRIPQHALPGLNRIGITNTLLRLPVPGTFRHRRFSLVKDQRPNHPPRKPCPWGRPSFSVLRRDDRSSIVCCRSDAYFCFSSCLCACPGACRRMAQRFRHQDQPAHDPPHALQDQATPHPARPTNRAPRKTSPPRDQPLIHRLSSRIFRARASACARKVRNRLRCT